MVSGRDAILGRDDMFLDLKSRTGLKKEGPDETSAIILEAASLLATDSGIMGKDGDKTIQPLRTMGSNLIY